MGMLGWVNKDQNLSETRFVEYNRYNKELSPSVSSSGDCVEEVSRSSQQCNVRWCWWPCPLYHVESICTLLTLLKETTYFQLKALCATAAMMMPGQYPLHEGEEEMAVVLILMARSWGRSEEVPMHGKG